MKRQIKKVKTWFVSELFKRLPTKTMRRVYFASLCGLLRERGIIDCNDVVGLNKRLNITSDPEHLQFYTWLHNFLWNDDVLEDSICLTDGRRIKLKDISKNELNDKDLEAITNWIVSRLNTIFTSKLKPDCVKKNLPHDTQEILAASLRLHHH